MTKIWSMLLISCLKLANMCFYYNQKVIYKKLINKNVTIFMVLTHEMRKFRESERHRNVFVLLVSSAASRRPTRSNNALCCLLTTPHQAASCQRWRGNSSHVKNGEDDAGHCACVLALLGPVLQRPALGRLGP